MHQRETEGERERERERGGGGERGYSNALSKPITPQTVEREHNLDTPTMIKTS